MRPFSEPRRHHGLKRLQFPLLCLELAALILEVRSRLRLRFIERFLQQLST